MDEFDYHLPEELIAQTPVEPRDASRLFVLPKDGGPFRHQCFFELPGLLSPGDLLVVNDTRVIPARLFGERPGTGGQAEFLLLRPLEEAVWEVLVRPGKRFKPGSQAEFGGGLLRAEILRETDFGGRVVRFHASIPLEHAFEKLGRMPLPPYIRERLDDPERYQTVYAAHSGSVAAPTAGLHFTPGLMETLKNMGVGFCRLTLHVGLGTFRPVSVETVEAHHMHAEFYCIDQPSADLINDTRQRGHRVIAVGTTSVRTIETVTGESGLVRAGSGWTDIFIYPGYRFKAVDGLITNFHLPRSTLLMLVSAMIGRERLMSAYHEAIARQYRFYSFGDAMIII